MRIFTVSLMLLSLIPLQGQTVYEKYFTDKVLRFDFMLAGNSTETAVYPVGMKEEPYFSGSRQNLVDPFNYGNFRYEVFDSAGDVLIYSRGFCTLFQEWQTTEEALTTDRSFYEVATMPFPKNEIRFVLSIRGKNGNFSRLYETAIDPDDFYIRREKPVSARFSRIYGTGDPALSVDLAFIAEGYRADEMEKFRNDVKKLSGVLVAEAPFNEYRDLINIWAVEAVSEDSGTDVPGERIYVNTVLNSSFYTFGTDRYLTTTDIKVVNDFASIVPHDNIIVLINSNRYGGGGVYNYYSGTTSGHQLSPVVFIHEFGHGFAGLADEYYTSDVAYNDFYPISVEPWEPNITTLVSFESKWKNLISNETPMPTPAVEKYKNTVGLFEGAGYSARGIYRAETDCRMKSNGPRGYCTVCREAVRKMIEFYTR
jgi:hypothetical protein